MKIRIALWNRVVVPVANKAGVRSANRKQIADMFMRSTDAEHYGIEVGPFLVLWPKRESDG